MKILHTLLLLIVFNIAKAQTNEYGYPVDAEEQIEYKNELSVEGTSKEMLYKRALKFITLQEYDRVAEVKTKIRGYYTGQIVERPIVYKDLDEGKIYGNGWFPFEYRNKDYFVVTFDYKISVSDGRYSYVFNNFRVKEYIHLGKVTGTSHNISGSIGKSTSKDAGSDIRTYTLEHFITFSAYERSHELFVASIKKIRSQLKKIMTGED